MIKRWLEEKLTAMMQVRRGVNLTGSRFQRLLTVSLLSLGLGYAAVADNVPVETIVDLLVNSVPTP